MNPHQKNKIDVSTLSPEEQRAFRLYGKLPTQASRLTAGRKYFDSGDYALNKAGKGDPIENGNVGSEHPDPESIRHHQSPTPTGSGAAGVTAPTVGLNKSGSVSAGSSGQIPVGSPAKESGLQRETSAEDNAAGVGGDTSAVAGGDAVVPQSGIPIRPS